MEIHCIPVQDKYIIYRPLRRLAFVGNRSMADLALQSAGLPAGAIPAGHPQALAFLESIGFHHPDPPPPAAPDVRAPFRPTSAALLMTGRCNLRCIYCYASGGEKENRDLSLEAACAVVDQVCRNAHAAGQPFFEVTFHGGGEPSLAWDTLSAIAAHARRRELPARLNMVSNGVWNRTQRQWVIANLDGLTISMDGGQATQDAQRPFPGGKGSFQAVMHTIRCLDQANFAYNLRVTATPEGFAALPADVDFFCRETGCQTIQVEPCFYSQRGGHHAPSPQQAADFAQAFLAAYDVATAAGRFMYYSGARPWLLTTTFCTAPLGGALTINPRGEIVACYEITDQDHALASSSTFGRWDAGQGSIAVEAGRRRTFLSSLADRRSACQECFCYWHCAGDCYTRAFPTHGAVGEWPYARCPVNRSITTGLLLRAIAAGGGVYRGETRSES
ncbi:MAG: radical SAM protein [Anaerolineaceae bacterium]|nr:radical SAM protein [Anaerolineaceae bacterium]